VFADGKKVTDVDSPTGDHALIDITKLVGINPQVVTVRTKSRDAQSADSMATPIPRMYCRNFFALQTFCIQNFLFFVHNHFKIDFFTLPMPCLSWRLIILILFISAFVPF
jgi:hypothetical protein